mgnify:CR=1 FL=1
MNKELRNKIKKIFFSFLKYLPFLILGFFAFGLIMFFYYTYDLPRPEKFTETPFIQSTKIYDRTGKVLLYDIYGEEKRSIVSFDKISINLKNSVISSEDERFYKHKGIDFRGILRSVLVDLRLRSRSQGGSTITQQLIRSVYLTANKTISRKVKEIVLSIELERRYSKDQIFEWYLNQIPFGENAYGIEAASQAYFKKSASELSLAESALLTSIIPAPSYYSPYGSHKDQLLKRKDALLDKMARLGYITQDQATEAKAETLEFAESTVFIKAPHFVIYVKQYLENKYGEDFLKEKGLRVYTTLDYDLQSYAEEVVSNADQSNKNLDANNTALVVIDPKTGEILTHIGSKDYFGESYPEGCDKKSSGSCLFDPNFDVATMGLRQPGSSFKPFVYATAFEKGYTPDTVLWDVKTEFNPNCNPNSTDQKDIYGNNCYHPQNYDGKNRGLVTLRSSLAQSLNIPAVKLLYLAGTKDSLKTSKDFGITTLNDPDRYGLSLVLGGGEVTLLQMTSAYGVFATEGLKIAPSAILKIEDSNGNTIEQNNKQLTKVINTQTARQINDVLSDNEARTPLFGANSNLYIPGYQVAAKTGTTQFYNDAWTIGYSPFAVVGVWVGNNNNSSTDSQTGSGLAAPIWKKVMQKLLSTRPQENFIKPDLIEDTNPILLGKIPSDDSLHSILYYIDKNNPQGPSPKDQSRDPLYNAFETGVKNWLNPIPQNTIELPPQ